MLNPQATSWPSSATALLAAAHIEHPAAILAVLLTVLAIVLSLSRQRRLARFFNVVPALVFCYFVPTTLTTCGILPAESALYDWIKQFVLPASLLLIILALDVPAILRLGPKAIVMTLAGTTGVVIGGPLALLVGQAVLTGGWALPPDAWKGMAALSGSWIGGGANFVAISEVVGTPPTLLATMVIADVFVANLWMGLLLYAAGRQQRIDAWTQADTTAVRHVQERLAEFQARTARIASLAELMMILALGFAGSWVSRQIGLWLPELGTAISHSTWKYILITALGIGLSFTPARNLEGAGASRIGTVLLYLLVACIGASADFTLLRQAPGLIVVGLIWILLHGVVLLSVGWLIRAPVFLVAVGSQANIGGAASAPVVAAAYHPSLAPVGALLAVLGYVLGTYAGLICAHLLKWVAGAT